VQEHYNLREQAAAAGDLSEWQRILDNALRVQVAVEILAEKLQSGMGWIERTFGTFGMSGLNAGPLLAAVPLAVIIGSISAVVSVTYAIYAYRDGLRSKWQYLEQHPELTPQQVAEVLNAGSMLGGAGNVAMWIALGGLALILLPQMMKGEKK
jgi:hypothetical protein